MVMFFPMMLFQVLLIAFGSHFPMKAKIVGGYAMLTFFSFIFLFFSYYIHNKTVSFVVTIIFVLLIGKRALKAIGTFNAVAQSVTLGLFSALGCNGRYMSAAMIGNGISGIFTNILQFICLAGINHQTLGGKLFHIIVRTLPCDHNLLRGHRLLDGWMHLWILSPPQ